MSAIRPESTIGEVAAVVSEALRRHGIDAVLSGGAVVSIYSDNEYESSDLDFVIRGIDRDLADPMHEIGFDRSSDLRHWEHPDTAFYVEFPPGPVAVGDRVLDAFRDFATPVGRIRMLTPTQAVMDRLAAFYHWSDRQSLDQAVMIARNQRVNLGEVKRWSAAEGMMERYEVFAQRLSQHA